MLILLPIALATTFTENANGPLGGDGSRGWGMGVGDIDGDGWLDFVTLGSTNESIGGGARLLIQDPNSPLTFTNETSAAAPGFADRAYGRGVMIADFDNDGDRDVATWSSDYLAVWLQSTDASGGLLLGDSAGQADFELVDVTWAQNYEPGNPNTVAGLNLEGLGLLDPDRDQVLDIQAGHRFMRIWAPGFPAQSTYEFGADGLDALDADDDWCAMEDLDGDRSVDMVLGRAGTSIFYDTPSGWTEDTSLQLESDPYKGGIALCDFDDDGDLDLFRGLDPNAPLSLPPPGSTTSNQIWMNTSSGWVSAGNPGVDESMESLGAVCGDVDNDGDLDLFVTYADGDVVLLRNQGGGTSWVANNGGLHAHSGTVGGAAMADLDRDGALDVYIQEDGTNWFHVNDLVSDAFVTVEVLANVGSCSNPVYRDDYHAMIRVGDPSSGALSGVRPVMGPHSVGISGGNPVHVGLGSMSPDALLELHVVPWTPRSDGSDELATTLAIRPSDHPYQHVTFYTDDPDGDGIPNRFEGSGDPDLDGIPSRADLDSDDDGWLDSEEAGDPCSPTDTDGDGLYDFEDPDSDNDGAPDDTDCDRLDSNVTSFTFYSDVDGDGYGAGTPTSGCVVPATAATQNGDCDDGDASIHPGASEDCDPVDRDCDGSATAGAVDLLTGWLDADGDGFGTVDQELAACTLPGAYVSTAGDCDDTQPLVYPGNTEVCDGLDNDCNGTTDGAGAVDASDWWADVDNDGFGAGAVVLACAQPVGHRNNDLDCNDANGSVFPGAPEQCNAADDNCDGNIDENLTDSNWYPDGDGDGFAGPGGPAIVDCVQPDGHVLSQGDCDDANPAINPGAVEVCNGFDDDCGDGESDAVDLQTFYGDADGDGWGDTTQSLQACTQPVATAVRGGDCDDTNGSVNPEVVEVCNGVDDDCTSLIDDNAIDQELVYLDADGDGHGDPASVDAACPTAIPAGWSLTPDDCDDGEPLAWDGASETCDGVDNDCDSLTDAADPDLPSGATSDWYADTDGDGFGAGSPVDACTPPAGHVSSSTDCDDGAGAVYPGATEIPDNGIDEDCDGMDLVTSQDRDGDGLPDEDELPGDFDGDGIPNIDDPDSDNDGVLDGAETSPEAVFAAGDVLDSGEAPTPVYGCQTAPGSVGGFALLGLLLLRRRRCVL